MFIIYFVLVLALVGFVLWLVENYVPMPDLYKRVMQFAVIILLVLWLASYLLGGFGGISGPTYHTMP